jgi:hypothetical protein
VSTVTWLVGAPGQREIRDLVRLWQTETGWPRDLLWDGEAIRGLASACVGHDGSDTALRALADEHLN